MYADIITDNYNFTRNVKIITISKNIIEFYSFIEVKKSVEMKNNKNNEY